MRLANERTLAFAREQQLEINWGVSQIGSVSVVVPEICHRSLFTIYSDGKIVWNFGWFRDDERQREFRDELAERLVSELDAEFPANVEERWPSLRVKKWASRMDQVQTVLAEAIGALRKRE